MAAASGPVDVPRLPATTVVMHQKELVSVVEMDDDAFKAWLQVHAKTSLWDVVGVSRSAFVAAGDKNRTHTTSGFRAIARTYPWVLVTGGAAASQLLEGNMLCAYCHRSGAVAGTFRMQMAGAKKHGETDKHLAKAAAMEKVVAAAAQAAAEAAKAGGTVAVVSGSKRLRDEDQTLVSMGAVKRRSAIDEALRVRALVTSHIVSLGVPYTTVSKIFNEDMFTLLDAMRSGTGSQRTMHDTDMPVTVAYVKDFIKDAMAGKDVAIAIDGGSTDLLSGAKIIALSFVMPSLEFEFLAALEIRFDHETGVSLADFVCKTLSEYGLDPLRLRYYASDNGSPNGKAIKKLHKNKRGCYNVKFARCLAHCNNLLLKALAGPFEVELGLFSKLGSISAYIKAGGGTGRRSTAVEFAVRPSGTDSTATRWSSQVDACTYMRSVQTKHEIHRAEKRLRLLAAAGDASAAAALADVVAPMVHWNAFYIAVEAMEEARSTESEGGSVRKNDVLDFLVSAEAYGAVVLFSEICKTVSVQFALAQAGPVYAPKKVCVPASKIVRDFRDMLEELHSDTTRRDDMLLYVDQQILAQQASVRVSTYADAAAEGKAVSVVQKARDTAADEVTRTNALTALKKVLVASLKAAHDAACQEKLTECLDSLAGKEMFNTNVAPALLPSTDAALFDLLGVPSAERSPARSALLRSQWKSYVGTWKPPARPVSAHEGWLFWESLAPAAPDLVEVALDNLLKPDTSGSVERIFSAVTHMDDCKRQTMDTHTLVNTLLLRCNQGVVAHLVKEAANARRAGVRLVPQESVARVAQREAAFAAAAATLAQVVVVDADDEEEGGGSDALMEGVFGEEGS